MGACYEVFTDEEENTQKQVSLPYTCLELGLGSSLVHRTRNSLCLKTLGFKTHFRQRNMGFA